MGAIIGPVRRPLIQPIIGVSGAVLPWEQRDAGGARSVSLIGQTFARNGERSYLISAPTDGATAFLAWAASNNLRLENRGDGAGDLVLIEHGITNLILQSRDITNAVAWANGGVGAIVTGNAGNGPDGAALADRVQAAGAQFCRGQTPGGTANPHVVSSYGRAFTGPTSIWAANYAAGTAWNVPALTTTYQRQSFLRAGAGSTFYAVDSSLPAASPQDVLVDLHQMENGRYPTSVVRTLAAAVAVDPDNLTLTSIPPWLLTGAARFTQFSPIYANTDLIAGDVRWLFTIGSANNGVRVRHDGANVLIEAVQAGVVRAASQAQVFSRHALRGIVRWDPPNGRVSVGGVNGPAGTPWTWASGTVRIGGIQGGAGSEADARFSQRLEAA